MKNIFHGRIGRKEFWIAYIPLTLFFFASCLVTLDLKLETSIFALAIVSFFGFLQTVIIFWRLHDINRSGTNILVGLIPIIGGIYLLYWFFKNGDVELNNYGQPGVRNQIVYTRLANSLIYPAYILSVTILIMYLA